MIVIKSKPDDALIQIDSSTQVPSEAGMLILETYHEVLPRVRKHLELWRQEAEIIPNSELSKQALLSIESKAFHCEGGAIYRLLAQDKIEPTIRFIIACQTICDYLDGLGDQSTSQEHPIFKILTDKNNLDR